MAELADILIIKKDDLLAFGAHCARLGIDEYKRNVQPADEQLYNTTEAMKLLKIKDVRTFRKIITHQNIMPVRIGNTNYYKLSQFNQST
jgi:hypothetical protein